MTAMQHTHNLWAAFLLMVAALVIVSGYTSINVVVKSELFPARSAGAWNRIAVRAHGSRLRRHRRLCRLLVQEHRPPILVSVVCHGLHSGVASRLHIHARNPVFITI